MVDPWLEGGGGIGQERLAEETGVPTSALRVEDPEVRPPTRRTGPVAGDDHLRPLADDVPAQPDPRPSSELEPETGRLGDRARHRRRQPRRLEDHQQDIRPSGERGQSTEPVGDRGESPPVRPTAGSSARRARSIGRQVDDEEIDRTPGDQRSGHRQGLLQGGRLEDDQPLEPHAPGDRLDRVEAAGEIQVGDDRAGRLGLGREPQGEGGLAARGCASDRERGRAGDPARAEDRIQRREPGPDDPIVVRGSARRLVRILREGDRGQCADDRPGAAESHSPDPWRGLPPARPEGRQGRRHVRGKGRHRTSNDRTDVLFRQSPDGPRFSPERRRGPVRTRSPRAPATAPPGAAPRGNRPPP